MKVTRNLEAALRQLRCYNYSEIWVDALCINQEDLEERSRQVLRMNEIYSQAYEIAAWLDVRSKTSRLARAYMKDLLAEETAS